MEHPVAEFKRSANLRPFKRRSFKMTVLTAGGWAEDSQDRDHSQGIERPSQFKLRFRAGLLETVRPCEAEVSFLTAPT
jgi:hypothetical protein